MSKMKQNPNMSDPELTKELLELLRQYCDGAHFVLSVMPVFDENQHVTVAPFNLASFPTEQVPDALERMSAMLKVSRANGHTKHGQMDFATDKNKMH